MIDILSLQQQIPLKVLFDHVLILDLTLLYDVILAPATCLKFRALPRIITASMAWGFLLSI